MFCRSVEPGELTASRTCAGQIITPGFLAGKAPANLAAGPGPPRYAVLHLGMQRMFQQPFATWCLHARRCLGHDCQAILPVRALACPYQKRIAIGVFGNDLAGTAVKRAAARKPKVLGFDLGVAVFPSQRPVLRDIDKGRFGAVAPGSLADERKHALLGVSAPALEYAQPIPDRFPTRQDKTSPQPLAARMELG